MKFEQQLKTEISTLIHSSHLKVLRIKWIPTSMADAIMMTEKASTPGSMRTLTRTDGIVTTKAGLGTRRRKTIAHALTRSMADGITMMATMDSQQSMRVRTTDGCGVATRVGMGTLKDPGTWQKRISVTQDHRRDYPDQEVDLLLGQETKSGIVQADMSVTIGATVARTERGGHKFIANLQNLYFKSVYRLGARIHGDSLVPLMLLSQRLR